jgi:signal transduction histidine kinase
MVLLAVSIVVATSFILERADDSNRYSGRFLRESDGLVDQLAGYYRVQNSWTGVEPMLVGAQAVYYRHDVAFTLADAQEQVIFHPQASIVGQSLAQLDSVLILPIQVEHQTVGFLSLGPGPNFPNDDRPSALVRVVINTLLIIAATGGLGGLVYGVVMSRTLTAPLNNLAEGARAIGARDLSRRVEEKGSDEMIAVARAFNEMASHLEQAEQLRRNLLADVAHELRTPLSVLQGNLRAILDEVYPLNQEEMARLYEHTRFLSRLVNDLHELAQAEAHKLPLNLQETDLSQWVKMAVDTFRPSAETKAITLHTELPARLPAVQVDTARLQQVLQNLLANALRHTPAGGTITLWAEPAANHSVCLSITDTGDGIAPDHLPHIFDRFYRADPARSRDRGGAGLGLAIARAIIEAHGGQIEATSPGIPGQGSTFTIRLPAQT